MVVTTQILIEKLKEVKPDGFEVSLSFGILKTTKAVYFRRGRYFVFNIEYDFNFNWDTGYKEQAFLEKYKDYIWKIEMTIG